MEAATTLFEAKAASLRMRSMLHLPTKEAYQQRLQWASRLLRAIFAEPQISVVRNPGGALVLTGPLAVPDADWVDQGAVAARNEAVRVIQLARTHHMSWRAAAKVPRLCT